MEMDPPMDQGIRGLCSLAPAAAHKLRAPFFQSNQSTSACVLLKPSDSIPHKTHMPQQGLSLSLINHLLPAWTSFKVLL